MTQMMMLAIEMKVMNAGYECVYVIGQLGDINKK